MTIGPARHMALPTGTVTFLFTDLEGSTRLIQALGDRYPELLEAHCRIVREAIAGSGGHEVSTGGDSFFAVFENAPDAVVATVAAQQGLAAQRWPDDAQVRVRMGLHTGEGKLGGDDYVGLDVNRAARVAAAAHGGQIVLSDSTRTLVEDSLPAGASLRELGAHRLRDLARPERLFQLDVPGRPTDFPALRTLDSRPHNLPVQLTGFIGRESELASVGELLDRVRLATLTGPGGTGKTRLALQVAAERLTRYGDGVCFVDLSPVAASELVPATIASALGVREAADRALIETLKEAVRDRDLLLVLDNFEQVIDAGWVVTELLTAAPRLRALVTSRAPLRVHGEHEHPVPPLRIPDPAAPPSVDTLTQYEGAALFIERAMAVRPDFAVTPQTVPAIAGIVARLDGLPLAIELAAAKAKLLGPQAILTRLEQRLTFLAGGPRDLPARQQTLRQAIGWSYELLASEQQVLMDRVAVFVGGWTLDAAEAVARPGDLGLDGLEALTALIDQSLIGREEEAHGEPRFGMLETIREFGLDRLGTRGEIDGVRRRHALHFLAVAEAAEPELTRSSAAGDRLAHDHDNLRAALAWAIEHGEAEVGLRLGFALWRFWQQRAHLREGRDWFDRLLSIPGADEPTAARAKGLTGAAGIAYWQNDYSVTEAWYAEAEGIIRGLGDRVWLADALFNTGSMAAIRGDMDAVAASFREGREIGLDLGDDAIVGRFLEGEGYMAFMNDDLARARDLLEQSLAVAERRGDRLTVAVSHHTVAQVARLDGRPDVAAGHYRSAIRMTSELGDVAQMTEPLQGLAAVMVATGEVERGVRLLGANAAIRERLGGGPPPEWLRLGDPLADARRLLSEDRYQQAWEAGLAMTDEQAVAEAIAASPGTPEARGGAGRRAPPG